MSRLCKHRLLLVVMVLMIVSTVSGCAAGATDAITELQTEQQALMEKQAQLEQDLQTLRDRAEIVDVVTRYGVSIGMHDWEGLRSCYTDEVVIDYSAFTGQEVTTYTADDWVQWARQSASGFEAVMHYLSNHTISIEGDKATCMSYVNSQFYLPNEQMDDFWAGGGYYTNDLVRTADGWKIGKTTLTIRWTQGSMAIFQLAAERAAETLGD